MRIGLLYLIIGTGGIISIIYLAIFGGEVSHSIAGIGKMIIGGLAFLWFLRKGVSRIQRTRIEKLAKLLGSEIKEDNEANR